jgi:hypothetical protein
MAIDLLDTDIQQRRCRAGRLFDLKELNHKTWSPRTGYVIISLLSVKRALSHIHPL